MSETTPPVSSIPRSDRSPVALARTAWTSRPERSLAALAGLVLFVSYALVFWVTGAADPSGAVSRSLINVLPLSVLAVLFYRFVQTVVLLRAVVVQVALHPLTALAYALAWYLGIQVLYGLQEGWITEGLRPRSFYGAQLTWQMFQGVTVYAVVATYAYAVHYWRLAARLKAERDTTLSAAGADDASKRSAGRLLLRQDRDIVPVDPLDIVRVSGAAEKTEVRLRTGRCVTTTMTMKDWERLLPSGFLRVHRSHLVALAAVLHAEPAGNGRLTLHLPNGDSIVASRTGTKAFREAAI